MRNRLIQILNEYFDIGDSYTYALTRDKRGFALGTIELDDFEEYTADTVAYIANHLIKNGVSVTQWYDAELIQPDDGIWVLVWCKQSKNSYSMMDFDCWHNNKWAKNGDRVTHWMPLPQPPEVKK